MNRFSDLLKNFSSDILYYWNESQENAIEALVDRTRDEIGEYIDERADIEARETGATLLPPRQARFEDSEDEGVGGIAEVMTNA